MISIENEKDNLILINNLACAYIKQNKHELAKEYFIKATKLGDLDAINKLEIYCNILEYYSILINISNKNDAVIKKINKLKKYRKIIHFENKKNMLSKIDQCPICLENTSLIPKGCAHFYCLDCYVKIKECAICRT